MPTCQSCQKKWSWKETIQKTTTLKTEITCPYCGEKQYQTEKSKAIVVLLIPTMFILFPLQAFFDVPRAVLLSLIPVVVALILLVHPFLVKLSNREKYIGEQ